MTPYSLLRKIAGGGMAEVFVGRWRGRIVAIKRILPHLAEVTRVRELFREEARVASLLRHPNVVGLHGAGSDFLALELVDGMDLRGLGELPAVLVAWMALSVAGGLGAAHRLGIVHRDVTPANILVGRDGTVKLTDFGLAGAGGLVGGTGPYRSPEQARGERLDARSDLYSLGVVMRGLSADPSLAPITSRLTEPDRAHRYPSADALQRDLERVLAGRVPTDALAASLPAAWEAPDEPSTGVFSVV